MMIIGEGCESGKTPVKFGADLDQGADPRTVFFFQELAHLGN